MPPKKWDEHELRLANALDVGALLPPNLTNEIHPILQRGRWQVKDHEYEALIPSLRLASHWIEVSIPYIATFLPADSLHQDLCSPHQAEDELTITLKNHVTSKELEDAREELISLAETTTWQVNYEIFTQLNWLGITRLVNTSRPWGIVSDLEIDASDERAKAAGHVRRPLIIGIMGEYIHALWYPDPTAEQYLRAAFMAACTITHEIGHAIFCCDFRSTDYTADLSEPYIKGDSWSELGFSFMGDLFGGWNPAFCDMSRDTRDFSGPLCWELLPRRKDTQKAYKELYSISMKYIEKLFTDSFWQKLGDPRKAGFSDAAKAKLKGNADENQATAMEPQFGLAWGEVGWKLKFKDLSNVEVEDVRQILTREEISLVGKGKSAVIRESQDALKKQPELEDEILGDDEAAEFYGLRPPASDKGTFANDQSESKDEHEFGALLAGPEPGKKFVSQIDDGWLELVSTPQINHNRREGHRGKSVITRIEVRYLSTTTSTPSQPHHRPSKKRKLSTPGTNKKPLQDPKPAPDNKYPDPYNIESLLRAWTVEEVEKRFTHVSAWEYCTNSSRDIKPGHFEATPQWQQANLDAVSDPCDLQLIHRIRVHKFLRANSRIDTISEIDGLFAGLRLHAEIRQSVPEWARSDLNEYCEEREINEHGSDQEVITRVVRRITEEMEEMRQAFVDIWRADLAGENVEAYLKYCMEIIKGPNQDDDDTAGNPRKWKADDFQSYFRQHSLPVFGTLRCQFERVMRHKAETETGEYLSRDTDAIYARTNNKSGWETYVFHANLALSTVSSLKSALFITGLFPSTAELSLYLGPDQSRPMGPEKQPLAGYNYVDWRDVRLFVNYQDINASPKRLSEKNPTRSPAASSVTSSFKEGLVVYHPRLGAISSRTVSTTDKLLKSNPQIRREAEVRAGRRTSTIADRLMGVRENVEELHGIMMPLGGRGTSLRPERGNEKSKSTVEILGNLENAEGLRVRGVLLKDLVEGEGDGGRVDGDSEDNLITAENSYMAYLYRSIKPLD